MAAVVLVPFSFMVLVSGPDPGAEQSLSQRLAELQVRLQYLEAMYRARQEDVTLLAQHLGQQKLLLAAATGAGVVGPLAEENASTTNGLLDSLSNEARALLRNMTYLRPGFNVSTTLRVPTAYNFLPHLLDDANSLRPAFLLTKGRTGVSVALGIPTVKRDKQSYLMTTLQNLIEAMSESEANDSILIVFVAETDLDYVLLVAKQIELRFPKQVSSGLLEVLAPHPSYYPNLDKLRITLDDPIERVRWRTKQNLDFAYLMTYAQSKATFYVQLEDDILAKKNFISSMKNYAIEKTARKEPWFALDFCQLGFIGKMFKSAELPWLITFFQMFYNDKPVDWLLDHLISTKICNWEKDSKHCKKEKAKVWIHYKPSLFQHIGMHSSLKGKVQKLKDKQFGKVPLYIPHKNPPADVQTGVAAYKQNTLAKAYAGDGYFWGLLPEPGDTLVFKFKQPIAIKSYLFRSGNAEHPSDRFYNTTIEILPASAAKLISDVSPRTNTTNDGYLPIGKFDSTGLAYGTLDDPDYGKIAAIRLKVHGDSENWAILSEIHIVSEDNR
uniref:Putative alpha-13-mannosyl-glycoprotein 4-beta-n-acetylglucosaminyltransferase b n=1 Tax=Xenopsylla cheopis TaxID=163159 RepID=A0A6M2DW15_XENCH